MISDIAEIFIFNETDAVYGDLLYVDTIDTENIRRYWKSGDFVLKNMRKGWTVPHPTFL